MLQVQVSRTESRFWEPLHLELSDSILAKQIIHNGCTRTSEYDGEVLESPAGDAARDPYYSSQGSPTSPDTTKSREVVKALPSTPKLNNDASHCITKRSEKPGKNQPRDIDNRLWRVKEIIDERIKEDRVLLYLVEWESMMEIPESLRYSSSAIGNHSGLSQCGNSERKLTSFTGRQLGCPKTIWEM